MAQYIFLAFLVWALWFAGFSQVVLTSTRWMQSWEKRWWLFGQTYHRRHWTYWLHHTRVSFKRVEHSDRYSMCPITNSPRGQLPLASVICCFASPDQAITAETQAVGTYWYMQQSNQPPSTLVQCKGSLACFPTGISLVLTFLSYILGDQLFTELAVYFI